MDYQGTAVNYIAGTPYLGASVRMYPGPGGYQGEFMAWDVQNARKVWSIKEADFPVHSGVLTTGGTSRFTARWMAGSAPWMIAPVKVLWQFETASGIVGNPMTFTGPDGKQYVAVYFWFPQREGFFRKTLNSRVCDVVMGVPVGLEEADSIRPYYRSTYVFVTRRDRRLEIKSLADPRLRTLRIGVHILGEQDDSLPPVHALISRGIVKNLVGFSIFGNVDEEDPPSDVIKAVEQGKVDVAIAWGRRPGTSACTRRYRWRSRLYRPIRRTRVFPFTST